MEPDDQDRDYHINIVFRGGIGSVACRASGATIAQIVKDIQEGRRVGLYDVGRPTDGKATKLILSLPDVLYVN